MSAVPREFVDAIATQFAEQQALIERLTQRIDALVAGQLVNLSLGPGPGNDPRQHTLQMTLADGSVISKTVELNVPTHRGRWSADTEYRLNEEVALDGCTWRCTRASARGPQATPGRCDVWALVSKRGARGPAHVPHQSNHTPTKPEVRPCQ